MTQNANKVQKKNTRYLDASPDKIDDQSFE